MAGEGDGGIPYGQSLGRFSELANRLASRPQLEAESSELVALREQLRADLGQHGLTEAAATVAIFNGLVRAADGTGIQLDERVFEVSGEFRDRLGLDNYGGAANSSGNAAAVVDWDNVSMHGLFGDMHPR